MKNQEVAKIFHEIADILEIQGSNPFRIRAYRRAAQTIDGLSRDIAKMQDDELKGIPGIGKDLTYKIREYSETGHLKFYDELKKEVPSGLVEMLSIPGLGPRTVKMFYDRLHIKKINDLEKLAKKGTLRELPGIQAKTEENILKGISMIRRRSERLPLGHVLPIAEEILNTLREKAPVKKLSLAGSLRRWKETIKDIDILVTSREPKKVMRVFTHLQQVKDVLLTGPTKSSIVTREGIQVDLRVVEDSTYGAALAYFTGSKAHNIRLREMAVRRGLKINEYGVFDVKTEKRIGGKEENDVYRILGLPFVPPELREDSGEIEAALKNHLPHLVTLKDLRGDLHVHSKDSDGNHSLEELSVMAREQGYKYIAITDHSKGLGVARGMSIEKVLAQNKRIKSLNKRLRGFRLLSGIEVDIRGDGTMDYPDEVLKKLDIVIASIHSGFRQSEEQLTRRLTAAMNNPYVSIIAHPTGRLLGEREAYEINMEAFLSASKKTGTAIEINAYPYRLDLNDIYSRQAKEAGIPLVISTDLHVKHQFDFMKYGIGTARRGWIEARDVLNTSSYNELIKFLKQKR
ncbi:DNA polymerase/3'-5' exonuclease PolX [bacterium]|nr:MAG: DNA polymerase/3'-5' exonuclease PolX [bacterium]